MTVMAIRLATGKVIGVVERMAHDRLLEVRRSANLNQSEMAKRAGTSYRSYRAYETGKREITFKVLRTVVVEFELDANWLLFGDEDRPQPSIKQS